MAGVRRRVRLIAGGRRLDPLRQAEVEDLDVPVLREEDVVGLQVPVDDPALVRRGEAAGDLEAVVDGLPLRDRDAAVEPPAERFALEELRDGVGDAVVPAEVVDREDVRVRERRDRLGFSLETRERVGVVGDRCSASTLIATSRSSFVSRAR